MAWVISIAPSFLNSSSKLLSSIQFCSSIHMPSSKNSTTKTPASHPLVLNRKNSKFICRAEKEYKFPDPIPEFADSETEKFETHLFNKLSKKDTFGDSIDEVIGICTEIFNTFLHTEYGGPGTLLVLPFIDMADTINERGLPGGPQAAN